ncbi:MBL fold metallo-hydrolase [candidate division KSB1 bacterium]|nr:MBL fold metallo-hydrolase [candidate division KSB1 bacterium]
MKVKFYGTRGSIPVCNPEFQEFGGNTTCFQISFPDTGRITIIDAGTGIRDLGKALVAAGHQQDEIFIAFTHFHWDHIQGFPFFAPAFDPGQKINILALGKGRKVTNLRGIFATQMQAEYFPVQLDSMGAHFEFMRVDKASEYFYGDEGTFTKVTANRHNHPGGAYGFRVERQGKVLVICTDIEHGDKIDPNVVKLSQGADLLIHEAQYTNEELKSRRGWGHSSYEQALQVAEMAGVKMLAITHHDPDHDDAFLRRMEQECQRRFPHCVLAREKMEIAL